MFSLTFGTPVLAPAMGVLPDLEGVETYGPGGGITGLTDLAERDLTELAESARREAASQDWRTVAERTVRVYRRRSDGIDETALADHALAFDSIPGPLATVDGEKA